MLLKLFSLQTTPLVSSAPLSSSLATLRQSLPNVLALKKQLDALFASPNGSGLPADLETHFALGGKGLKPSRLKQGGQPRKAQKPGLNGRDDDFGDGEAEDDEAAEQRGRRVARGRQPDSCLIE